MRIIAILISFALLSGCSGLSHFTSTYSTAPRHEMEMAGESYTIADREDLKSLYIYGPASNGTRSVATDYKDDIAIDLKQAASKYLASSGRKECSLDKGKEMMYLQYEFTYKCK
jgi:hypothetical protein